MAGRGPKSRLQNFKKNGKKGETRRRRNEASIEQRKKEREEILLKRRNVADEGDDDGDISINLDTIILKAKSEEPSEQISGVHEVGKIILKDPNFFTEFVNRGILPVLVNCLKQADNPTLQFEAACVLTKIVAGTSEQVQQVVNSGAIPVFFELLQGPHQHIWEQALQALGSIISNGSGYRNYLIWLGVVTPLFNFIVPDSPIELLRCATWFIAELCRSQERPLSRDTIRNIMPALCQLINYTDHEVLADTIRAFSYIANEGCTRIQLVVDSGAVPKIVSLLSHKNDAVQLAALRAVGDILTGTDKQAHVVLHCNALDHFPALLRHSNKKIIEEAVWAISILSRGNQQEVKALIDSGLIAMVIHLLNKGELEMETEAAWVVCNLAVDGTKDQVEYLVSLISQKGITPLCNLLTDEDVKVVQGTLEALKNILKTAGSRFIIISTQLEKGGGLDKIEALLNHKDQDINKLAYDIIDHYFM